MANDLSYIDSSSEDRTTLADFVFFGGAIILVGADATKEFLYTHPLPVSIVNTVHGLLGNGFPNMSVHISPVDTLMDDLFYRQ